MDKYCTDCLYFEPATSAKPLPTCGTSKYTDMVTGKSKRPCFIERIDGLGVCGTMGNGFKPKGAAKTTKKAKAKKDG